MLLISLEQKNESCVVLRFTLDWLARVSLSFTYQSLNWLVGLRKILNVIDIINLLSQTYPFFN